MKINPDVLDGKVKRVCGNARERRGVRAGNYREIALGQLEFTAGILQERRGRLVEQLELVRVRLNSPVDEPGAEA